MIHVGKKIGISILIVSAFMLTRLCNHYRKEKLSILVSPIQAHRKLLKSYKNQPVWPKQFEVEPVFDIPLPKSSCFLACVRTSTEDSDLTCHFREHYRKSVIGKVVLDGQTFRIKSRINRDAEMDSPRLRNIYSKDLKSITSGSLIGEDPRAFVWDGKMYVMNNKAKANTLYEIGDHGATLKADLPQFLGKKNITPIPLTDNKGIMFIDFQEQKINVCARTGLLSSKTEADEDNQRELSCEPFWKEVVWKFTEDENVNYDDWWHRGGTAGIEVDHGVFVGFGHTTHKQTKELGAHHDIWFWKLDMRKPTAYLFMSHIGINHEVDYKITDPTSLVHIDDDWYLFTAESNDHWGANDVVFVNRVYRIVQTEGWNDLQNKKNKKNPQK